MIRRLLAIGLLSFGLLVTSALQQDVAYATPMPAITVAYGSVEMFSTEETAQAHCPRDVVVWLNTKSGIWHEKGMRWYGRTKHGAFVCRTEAAAAGYRDTENGQ